MEVKKNNTVIANFVYDGDGKRVKGTVNGVITLYPFAHYEVSGENVTKYYFAGSQVVALNQGGTLSYLFPDHLGGTAVTTTQSGIYETELRYKAWGETRFSYGTTPTSKHYTGQYEEAGIGLYYYNARWYDPALSRFAQADTIVPEPGDAFAFDRFAYGKNNPLSFNDPSGHNANNSIYLTMDANTESAPLPELAAFGLIINGYSNDEIFIIQVEAWIIGFRLKDSCGVR